MVILFLLFLTTMNCPSSTECFDVSSLRLPSEQPDARKLWSYQKTLLLVKRDSISIPLCLGMS